MRIGKICSSRALPERTVANTCTQIKAKLGVTRTTDLVRLALEAGVT